MKSLMGVVTVWVACFAFGCSIEPDESTNESDEIEEVSEDVETTQDELKAAPDDKECFGCSNGRQTCCVKGSCWEESC